MPICLVMSLPVHNGRVSANRQSMDHPNIERITLKTDIVRLNDNTDLASFILSLFPLALEMHLLLFEIDTLMGMPLWDLIAGSNVPENGLGSAVMET